MRRFLQQAAAAAVALILSAGILSPAVYGLRVYDETAQDFPTFSAAARRSRTAQTENTLIVKTDGTLPDFRAEDRGRSRRSPRLRHGRRRT